MRKVEVTWVDSMMLNYGEWASRSEHEEAFSEMTHHSCGYIFAEVPAAIILAHTVYETSDRAAGAMLIPRNAVVSMRILKEVEEDE